MSQSHGTDYRPLVLNDELNIGSSPQDLVEACNRQRLSLHGTPTQSNFNVVALFFIQDIMGRRFIVEGMNAEQGYMGGAICAERSVMTQLRKYADPVIEKVVITTDSDEPISPGVLCREYMMSCAADETPIILGNADSSVITGPMPLRSLHPAPYVYRKQDRDHVPKFSVEFAQLCQSPINAQFALWDQIEKSLVEKAFAGRDTTKRTTSLHPISFSAAVLFLSDEGAVKEEDIEVSGWLPALEFGATLCPVQLLLREFEKRKRERKAGAVPAILCMVDNVGVVHAPFASARSLLAEYGYHKTTTVLYHHEDGTERKATIEELCPPPPGGAFLTHDAFI